MQSLHRRTICQGGCGFISHCTHSFNFYKCYVLVWSSHGISAKTDDMVYQCFLKVAAAVLKIRLVSSDIELAQVSEMKRTKCFLFPSILNNLLDC